MLVGVNFSRWTRIGMWRDVNVDLNCHCNCMHDNCNVTFKFQTDRFQFPKRPKRRLGTAATSCYPIVNGQGVASGKPSKPLGCLSAIRTVHSVTSRRLMSRVHTRGRCWMGGACTSEILDLKIQSGSGIDMFNLIFEVLSK